MPSLWVFYALLLAEAHLHSRRFVSLWTLHVSSMPTRIPRTFCNSTSFRIIPFLSLRSWYLPLISANISLPLELKLLVLRTWSSVLTVVFFSAPSVGVLCQPLCCYTLIVIARWCQHRDCWGSWREQRLWVLYCSFICWYLLTCHPVFFGHLTPWVAQHSMILVTYDVAFRAVEDLRYQHTYHPVSVEKKCPALANVLNQISAGLFGDGAPYEPWVVWFEIAEHDYWLFYQSPQFNPPGWSLPDYWWLRLLYRCFGYGRRSLSR